MGEVTRAVRPGESGRTAAYEGLAGRLLGAGRIGVNLWKGEFAQGGRAE